MKYYTITVSRKGFHHFTTASNSIHEREMAIELYNDLFEHFTSHNGFLVELMEWETATGRTISDAHCRMAIA